MESDQAAGTVDSYRKLLSELLGNSGAAGVRSYRWPSLLLPAPREDIVEAIEHARVSSASTTHTERLDIMEALLERFADDQETLSSFLVRLVLRPILISIFYAIWLAVRGEGWWWLAAAAAVAVGSYGGAIHRYILRPRQSGIGASLVGSLVGGLFTAMAYAGSGALWIRLVIVGGVVGLYQNVLVRLDLPEAAFALGAVVVGYFYSKALNTLYRFLR